MFPFKPLMAADWIEIAIFLFIVFSSLIGQLFKAAKPKQKRGQQPPKAKPRPIPGAMPEAGQMREPARAERAPSAGPGQAAPRPSTLEKEIEDFLRQHRPGQGGANPPARQPAATGRPPAPPRRKAAPDRPRETRKPRPALQPAEVEDVRARESVAQHVERHVRTGGVASREPVLGEQIDQADERLEARLQEVFHHSLGQLGGGTSVQPGIAPGTDAAVWDKQRAAHPLYAQLYQMLSSPQQAQAAIILSEILRRPEERWS